MRIIGGHDYYDSALAYGHDETVVLVREKDKTIAGKVAAQHGLVQPLPYGIENNYRSEFTCETEPVTVVLAGKIYTGIRIGVWPNSRPRSLTGERPYVMNEYVWTKAALDEIMSTYGFNNTRSYLYWTRARAEPLDRYFEPRMVSPEAYNYLVKERISILVSVRERNDETVWKVNPDCLKDIGFPRVMDPYTIFQELDMWVSGVLGMPANAMVEVSNDTKIHKHGFDKTSFRKPKQA